MTTDLHLNGALGKNMMPLFPALTGAGNLQTPNVALQEFPAAGEARGRDQAPVPRQPDACSAIKTGFQIKDGRLVAQPFDVKLGRDHA